MFQLLRRLIKAGDPVEREKQLRIDFELTFSTDHGKRVFTRILEQGHFFEPCRLPGMIREDRDFRDGERNMALMVLEMLQIKDIEKLQEYVEE